MSLATGSRLGAHEIIGLLGAGGMGEVYLAQDTKLNRRVAIKVLPEAYASDPDRIARFHREAQAVAALNHQRIAAIYDLAEADGVRFLVLELVEGDTLADRLRLGPLPVEEAILVSIQILEALEAAHEKGICHRDLKPANVKLTPDGAVKVLDFGLAKFLQSGPAAANLTNSPTLTLAGSFAGVILGTAGYMSPEQAKGVEADQRSDIFSFGCILFELLTGRRAFEGESASEILASVIKTEPDLAALPPTLNPRITETLRRCLEKNRKNRWHAAADVRVELEAVRGRGLVVEEPLHGVVGRARPLWRRAMPVSAVAILGLALAYAAWTLKPEPARTVMRFSVPLPEGQQFTNLGRQLLALSPDGTNLVYVANRALQLRSMSSLESHVIVGSDVGGGGGIVNPVFSPDGQSVAFGSNADNTLKRIALTGGAAVTICAAQQLFGMSWDEHGILFGQAGKGIFRVSPDIGVPELVAAVASDEHADAPQLLPGGAAVLFSVKKLTDTWDKGLVVVQPLAGGERKTLISGGSDGRYLPTGHLVYALEGVLLGAPFDLGALALTGAPVPILVGVRRGGIASGATAVAQFSYSNTGALVYVPGPVKTPGASGGQLALFDRKGSAQPLPLPPGSYGSPRVSPDGRWITFDTEGEKEVFVSVYELAGGTAVRRLTFGGRNRAPVWSPDGQWIAFQSDREGDMAMFRQRADGSGAAERLTTPEAGAAHTPHSWSRDGAHLLFTVLKDRRPSVWTLTLKDGRTAVFGDAQSRAPVFSPDGRWIAYQTSAGATGGIVVFIEPFPRTKAKYLVPQPGGHPYWSPKGDELILNTGQSRSAVVSVTTSPRVAFGRPADFPRGRRSEPTPIGGHRNVDMMPDGEHVVGVLAAPAELPPHQITVVLNWFDEIRQRVPVP